jgi:TolB-like protein
MPLAPNTRLGPYEIIALLGRGGMGEIYRARDTRLGRLVAIKVLSAGGTGNPDRVRRLLQEAQAASALNHSNIVTIHDVGSEHHIDFIAMELVDGQTLADIIPRQGMALGLVLKIGLQIADALAAAHAAGIVHRDLKPGNVMVTADTRVKLLDFGLAKMSEDPDVGATRTTDGTLLGTFAYMSPEQAQGKQADARSDVFAFGAVLYEMLSGRRAFPGEAATEIITAVLRDEPAPLAGVAPALANVVTRCLRKNPSERYARIADVKAILDRLQIASNNARPETEPSIAVLPFANLSADKENEYFSDGLAEEILNALTRVPGLKVTARTSAFAFRGKDQDIRKIGEALDVRTVLEGSVRRAGNRIRVTAQLINASDGYHLWSERYDRDMTDVFAIQDEMARAIVDALKVQLTGAPPVATRQTVNVEAYHAYLKGRYHFLKLTPESVARGRACFDEAIALDPNYAPAHARLAHSLHATAYFGWKSPREVMPLAKAAALKALDLDEGEPDAQFVLAAVAGQFEYNWQEALRRCQLALACPAVPPDVGALCATFILLPLGRVDEAITVIQRSSIMDPLSPYPQQQLAAALAARGSDAQAIESLQRLLELHETFWAGYFFLGCIYTGRAMTQEAIASLEKCLQLMPSYPGTIGLLAGNYAQAGDRARAERLLAQLTTEGRTGARAFATFHAVCSEFESAADYFEQAIEERDLTVIELGMWPFFAAFRKSPRGRAVLQKMNLADVERA